MTKLLRNLGKELERCRASPVRFCERWLGIKNLYDKQVEILEAVRDYRRVAVRACHASGKTFLAGAIFWWEEICFPNSITVTTAPTDRQVKELLWGEIRKHYGNASVPLPGEPSTQHWRMPDVDRVGENARWFGTGFSTRPDQAEQHASRFTGYHANPPGRNLTIFDEASGILRSIFNAAEGLLTSDDDRQLLIGNPLDPVSEFAARTRSPLYHSIRISAFDTPNVKADRLVPGYEALVSPRFVRDQAELEGEDSPLYIAKVLGEFPEGGEDTLIPLAWVTGALERLVEPGEEKEAIRSIGVDVARFGTDATVITVVEGTRILYSKAFYGRPTDETADRVEEIARSFEIGTSQAFRISVDDTGVGGGVTDLLRRKGYGVNAVDFGSASLESRRAKTLSASARRHPEGILDRFHDRRTEIWWNVRRWIQTANLADAPHRARERLEGDLSTPKYKFATRIGKTRRVLEPKDKMKERLGRSPDDGDALALALAYQTSTPVAMPTSGQVEEVEDGYDDEEDLPTGISVNVTRGELESFLSKRGRGLFGG